MWGASTTSDDIERRLNALYDRAASFIQDAGMSWTEFWSITTDRLDRYADACNRRAERLRAEAERERR